MRQIYYTIRTLLRERGSNIIRIISLSLGLTIGILLFSQIAFELSYEKCYPEAERLALVRCQMTNLSTGETAGDDGEIGYDYTVFDVVAPTLAEEMPKEIEVASSVLSMGSANISDEDKLTKVLENPQVIKTPVVRNGKQSTLGYQPNVWKSWK